MNIEIDNIEELKAEYINNDWLLEPEYFNYRINYNGQRFYARCYIDELENGETDYRVVTAPSFSAISGKVIPKGFGLEHWLVNNSADSIEFKKTNSALYGTIFHVYCGMILRSEIVPASSNLLTANLREYCLKNGEVWDDLKKWMRQENRDMLKDLMGFAKWAKDYKVKPIAIEYPVFSEKCAGTLDLVAEITIPVAYTKDELVNLVMKNHPDVNSSAIQKLTKVVIIGQYKIQEFEKHIALIDLKSGTKGFYEPNIMQLYQYAKCWNLENLDCKITKLFNYGCDNYRLPNFKYRFKDQTDNKKLFDIWDKYVEIFYAYDPKKPSKIYKTNELENITIENVDDLIVEVDPIQEIIDKQKGLHEEEAF